ncbi:FAD-dependent monooxygenase [Nonomuraea sediminis]|uniref:FAD-dependent monooxygenase n=1 Tax=Nonomuraea sediminis TaxID=2835864 RepID=UPI001BDC5E85|nr:FAD-dependent monooxygenase [Nonomuraea sediminis]
MTNDTEVVIAGAGPTGLMLAAELRLAGIDVVVLERDAEPSPHSRAFGMLPRTLEVLDQRGVADRFDGPMFGQADLAADMVDLDFTRLDTRYGQLLHAQARTERILRDWVRELGGELATGREVTGARQDEDGVTVDLADGSALRARYLAGCDGTRSTVRGAAGIGFPGEYSAADFVLVDLKGARLERLPLFERGPRGLLIALPIARDTVRVVVHEYGGQPGDREAPTWEEAVKLFARVADFDLTIGDPVWISRFRNTARLADTYRRGRILLAGDAAHAHLPAGGQGLNLGIQDAVNLGWKLAARVRGWAPEELLDSYESERRPVAGRVLLSTKAQFALMQGGPEVGALRTLLAEVLSAEEVNRRLAAELSGVGIRYDVGEGGHPPAGCRLPYLPLRLEPGGAESDTMRLLHRGRGVLLALADGPWAGSAEGWGDRVDAVRASAEGAGFACALIRPDGHVAWATAGARDGDGLARALRRWFGIPR